MISSLVAATACPAFDPRLLTRSASARIFHEFEVFIGKAFGGAAVQVLPQAPDNAANERLGLARRVKIFLHFFKIGAGCHGSPENQAANNAYISAYLQKKSIVKKKFHEMFGLEAAGPDLAIGDGIC